MTGNVYKGLNPDTGDFVAVKCFDIARLGYDKIQPFLAEIELLKSFSHPAVTPPPDSPAYSPNNNRL